MRLSETNLWESAAAGAGGWSRLGGGDHRGLHRSWVGSGWSRGALGLWDGMLVCSSTSPPPTHPRPEGPPPLSHILPPPTPDCSTAGHTKKTPRIVVYCNTFITLLSTVELIWDPAVFHVTAELPRGRRHGVWAGNQSLKGAELRLVSCFITEIFYQRETQLC